MSNWQAGLAHMLDGEAYETMKDKDTGEETAYCELCGDEFEKDELLVTWDEYWACQDCYTTKSGTLDFDEEDETNRSGAEDDS